VWWSNREGLSTEYSELDHLAKDDVLGRHALIEQASYRIPSLYDRLGLWEGAWALWHNLCPRPMPRVVRFNDMEQLRHALCSVYAITNGFPS
jgi:hypothetical protein